jgi:hypothetical protein
MESKATSVEEINQNSLNRLERTIETHSSKEGAAPFAAFLFVLLSRLAHHRLGPGALNNALLSAHCRIADNP